MYKYIYIQANKTMHLHCCCDSTRAKLYIMAGNKTHPETSTIIICKARAIIIKYPSAHNLFDYQGHAKAQHMYYVA